MSQNKTDALKALQEASTATLSVIDFETGYPMGSLVNVAATTDSQPLILISSLARHHKCLQKDSRASLLIALPSADGDPLTGFRAGFQGLMVQAKHDDHLKGAYLAKHPYAEAYIDFGDFSFWRMTPELVHVVGGFGRIETIRL